MPELFDVWQFFPDGTYEKVREKVVASEAAKAANHYCKSVGARMGMTQRVIITDMGDSIVFEWKYGEGVVFPHDDTKGM